MYELYSILSEVRRKRGAIEFETIETKIIFGRNRKIKEIVPVERNDAHRLIEECMLMANIAAADFLQDNKTPALYRVHEGPNPDKLADLINFFKEANFKVHVPKSPRPSDYAEWLKKAKERPDFRVVQTMILRSMMQARYAPDEKEHFGLALSCIRILLHPFGVILIFWCIVQSAVF